MWGDRWHTKIILRKGFTESTGELLSDFGELHNKEGLFFENQLWPQRICRAINQKNYFLTIDLRVIMAICWATRKICFLTATHGHLPSRSYKTFFADESGFSYWLSKASGSKCMQLCRNHTHFEYIRRTRDCEHALISVIYLCCRGPNRRTNPSEKFSIQPG